MAEKKLEITRIDHENDWRDIRETWNEVLKLSRSNTVFLTYEWLRAWWKVFGAGQELHILVARDDEGVQGLAPLYLSRPKYLGLITVPTLGFLGDTDVGSDFLDLIVRKGQEFKVIRALIEYLLEDDGWGHLKLHDFNGASPNHMILREQCRRNGLRTTLGLGEICPAMALPRDWDTFMAGPDRLFKKLVLRDVKKVGKRRQVQAVLAVDESGLDEYLGHLFALHQERWEAEGRQGSFSELQKKRFYQEVSGDLIRQGWLRLSGLIIDDKVEVVEYGLHYDNAYYSLQGGCSQEGLTIKAGNILTYYIFQSLVGNTAEFNYLRGEELYKLYWGCTIKSTLKIDVFRGPGSLVPLIRSTLYQGLKNLYSALKKHGK